eukprot:COSAG02_NODE_56750_length_284_cov_0.551351_1_plen_49_part_01
MVTPTWRLEKLHGFVHHAQSANIRVQELLAFSVQLAFSATQRAPQNVHP